LKLKEKFEKMKGISKELMELKDPMNLELTNQVVYCFNKHRDVMLFLNDFLCKLKIALTNSLLACIHNINLLMISRKT